MESFHEAVKLIISFNNEVYGIILLTLVVTVLSTLISTAIGVPMGVILGSTDFKYRKWILSFVNTFMGLPPVVAGLLVYILLSRKGSLGELKLLFTPTAMVIAQVLIVLPIIIGLTASAVKLRAASIRETCLGLALSRTLTLKLLLYECRYSVVSVLLAGYGRAVSEVGAVMLVGGNIQYNTRVMTTSIVLETGKGNYDRALALGFILLMISFLVNWGVQRFQEDA
ncbi:MAG: ABC transporter permease [Clostridia bacterium]|nr:ABC transporter permease [Clostridia bacterium]